MTDQETAGGILSREWRLLKPLSALLVLSIVVLLFAVVVYPVLSKRSATYDTTYGDAPPPVIVIHHDEKLSAEDIDFTKPKDIHGDNEDSVPGFKPLVVYRVATVDASKTFSHPYILNFMGEGVAPTLAKEGLIVVARLEGKSWKRTDKLPQSHSRPKIGDWWDAEVEGAGTYALCIYKDK